MSDFAAFYFPFAHADSFNESVHGKGWTEWELMRRVEARFKGHRQPRIPLWGYQNEADPEVMRQKVTAATAHGLNAFIFDWYWYEGKTVFSRALDEGFLALEQSELKFALMWANHDWSQAHPISLWQAKHGNVDVLLRSAMSEDEFIQMCQYIIERYFKCENYWQVDGKPFFSIYNLASLLESFGSVERAAAMLKRFRELAVAAGLPGLHLNAIEIFTPNIPHEEAVHEWPALIETLGFDSVTSYSWAHFTQQLIEGFEERRFTYPYGGMEERLINLWTSQQEKYSAADFFPHVTIGWDSSPRTVQSDRWENIGGGPFSFIWNDANPKDFEKYLRLAVDFQENQSKKNPIIINAWNEWPESSYLEPDTHHGMAYLEALKRCAALKRIEPAMASA